MVTYLVIGSPLSEALAREIEPHWVCFRGLQKLVEYDRTRIDPELLTSDELGCDRSSFL